MTHICPDCGAKIECDLESIILQKNKEIAELTEKLFALTGKADFSSGA